jgi:thiamine-monophosphate kinase
MPAKAGIHHIATAMTTEFTRIAKYFAPLAGEAGRGLNDDAAVFSPPKNRDLVLTTDQMLEGIHFLPGDPPDLIARKLLRRSLSDLAAMAATPLSYLLTTALPPHIGDEWLAAFAAGLAQDQAEYNIHLIGGDSSSSKQHISLTATFIGHTAPGAALSRNGAQPGDDIWVTGTIGDAALGLQARLGKLQDPTAFLTQRSLLPSPRVGLALAGIAHAAIDISDGLLQDLGHMCQGAGLAAIIHAALIPTSPEAAAQGDHHLEPRLTDGDDYELLLAVPPEQKGALHTACGALQITKIGLFSPGPPVATILDPAGNPLTFKKTGWQHF